MAKIAVFDMAGQQVSERELSDAVFAVTPNEAVMHAMVVNYLANQRQGTQSTLTRTEVAGGGRKPWRQKGTGHARQGSIRAPQWVHGGKALLVTAEADQKVVKSAANIAGVKTAAVNTLNVYDILNYDKFIVVEDAVAKIEEVYAK